MSNKKRIRNKTSRLNLKSLAFAFSKCIETSMVFESAMHSVIEAMGLYREKLGKVGDQIILENE